MDPNILKNLGLDSKMSPNDLNLINQILTSTSGTNKSAKMTAKDRNNLINKLSSTTTLSELPQKDLKDMNEEEKKIYREELKKKLKNKQNEKKMIRTNNIGKNKDNYNDVLGKLGEMMKNIPNDVLMQTQENKQTNNNLINSDQIINNQINTDQSNKINNIDKINYIINKKYENTDTLNTDTLNTDVLNTDVLKTVGINTPNEPEDLNDYIK